MIQHAIDGTFGTYFYNSYFISALEDAIKYAEGLVGFPQEALRADRNSARRAFSASSIEESLLEEYKKGIIALEVSFCFLCHIILSIIFSYHIIQKTFEFSFFFFCNRYER